MAAMWENALAVQKVALLAELLELELVEQWVVLLAPRLAATMGL